MASRVSNKVTRDLEDRYFQALRAAKSWRDRDEQAYNVWMEQANQIKAELDSLVGTADPNTGQNVNTGVFAVIRTVQGRKKTDVDVYIVPAKNEKAALKDAQELLGTGQPNESFAAHEITTDMPFLAYSSR